MLLGEKQVKWLDVDWFYCT